MVNTTPHIPMKNKDWSHGLDENKSRTIIRYGKTHDTQRVMELNEAKSDNLKKRYRCRTCSAEGEVVDGKLSVGSHASHCKFVNLGEFLERQRELEREKTEEDAQRAEQDEIWLDDDDDSAKKAVEVITLEDDEPPAHLPSPASEAAPYMTDVDMEDSENVPPDDQDVSMEMAKLAVQDATSEPEKSTMSEASVSAAMPTPVPSTPQRNKRSRCPSSGPRRTAEKDSSSILDNHALQASSNRSSSPGVSQPKKRRHEQPESVVMHDPAPATSNPAVQMLQSRMTVQSAPMNGPPAKKAKKCIGSTIVRHRNTVVKYPTPSVTVQKIWRASFGLPTHHGTFHPKSIVKNLAGIYMQKMKIKRQSDCQIPKKLLEELRSLTLYKAFSLSVLGSETHWRMLHDFLYDSIFYNMLETSFYTDFPEAKAYAEKRPIPDLETNKIPFILCALGALFRCRIYVHTKNNWRVAKQYRLKDAEDAGKPLPANRPCLFFISKHNIIQPAFHFATL
uniref:DDE_Tnp_1_7 domain-containing protein n=1 Tax=Panagrellus redivivus TaxID=6233 RepID=A0A7E4URX9_PANRE